MLPRKGVDWWQKTKLNNLARRDFDKQREGERERERERSGRNLLEDTQASLATLLGISDALFNFTNR